MCTLLIAFQTLPGLDLFLASNRDEFLDRPTGDFRRWTDHEPEFVAPVDLRAGGTWLGLGAQGLGAAITNRFGEAPEPDRRSRGELVPLALAQPTVGLALERLMSIEAGDYNPFHIFVGSGLEAGLVWSDGQKLKQEWLSTGYHVVTERSFGVPGGNGREEGIRRALHRNPSREAMLDLLSRESSDPSGGAHVRLPDLGYGTRSSTWMEWKPGSPPTVAHARGGSRASSYEGIDWNALSVSTAD